MAKKSKDQIPNPNSVTNRDIIQRLNFLYQASIYMNGISREDAPTKSNKKRRKRITTDQLSRHYISEMKAVGQKTIVKMDPAVKRTLCGGCDAVLIPGSSATVRVKKSLTHVHTMIYTCNHCKETRRIPAPPSLPEKSQGTSTSTTDKRAKNPPLALRPDAGHIIFRGQEQLE
ncbi:Rpr2-domain-containing protein, partial [Cylindrobasidium torrendii FP15055 ss-10]